MKASAKLSVRLIPFIKVSVSLLNEATRPAPTLSESEKTHTYEINKNRK